MKNFNGYYGLNTSEIAKIPNYRKWELKKLYAPKFCLGYLMYPENLNPVINTSKLCLHSYIKFLWLLQMDLKLISHPAKLSSMKKLKSVKLLP